MITDKTEVLNILKDTGYHSPEDSEMDKEQLNGNRKIIITYNLSWHSDEGETMIIKADNCKSQPQTNDNTQTEYND
ncbi:unnamed protein product [Rhizophagus irregularis]|nr:unnamed protein product [Rhizophagus irregularis]